MNDCFPNVCLRYFYFAIVVDLGCSNGNVRNDCSRSADVNQEKDKYVADSVFLYVLQINQILCF